MSNPRTTSYEFLGPPGALAISVGVPIITYALYFGCSETTGGCPPQLTSIDERILASATNLDWWKGLWDTEAALIYLGWYTFCVVAWAILPGDQVEGTPLRTGGKKQYKINGTTLN
jgi:Delta14-sterol reductase